MVTVPKRDEREEIARAPFLDEMLGVMVARHDDEGPILDVHIEPADSGQAVDFELTLLEAHVLADELHEIATTAQRAGWTPTLIADVRDHYLPGAADDEIVTRLDGLVERLGSAPVLRPGVLRRDAGLMLIADAHRDVQVEHAALDASQLRAAHSCCCSRQPHSSYLSSSATLSQRASWSGQRGSS